MKRNKQSKYRMKIIQEKHFKKQNQQRLDYYVKVRYDGDYVKCYKNDYKWISIITTLDQFRESVVRLGEKLHEVTNQIGSIDNRNRSRISKHRSYQRINILTSK